MRRIRILFLTLFTFAVSVAWPQAEAPKKQQIVSFDAPGAGTGAGQGTFAFNIVSGGSVSGKYIDASGVHHGFLRSPDGTITTFDVPGGGQGAGQGVVEVWGMTPALEIVGSIRDANNVYHGFLRTRDGRFVTFDCPGSGHAAFQGSEGLSVNPAGLISGDYFDLNYVNHGCLRAPDGTLTSYDPPDAGTFALQGTYPSNLSGITPEGAIVGEYLDSNYVWHAFRRATDGTFTEFDAPGAGTGAGSGQGTLALGINPPGEISGLYIDASYAFHGYMRAPDGSITEYDVPGAGAGIFQGTNACWFIPCFGGIIPAGTVTGFDVDSNNVYHGFLRTRDGKITTFDAPGAGTVGSLGGGQGTQALTINNEGTITGYYTDANNVVHGFVRLPDHNQR